MWDWSFKLKLAQTSAFVKRDLRLLPMTDAEFEADFFLDRGFSTKRREAWRSATEKDRSVMNEVDFSDDLWLFASPWCEQKLEHGGYVEKIALAWVALWNYTVDPTSMKTDDLSEACKGLFDIPNNELTEILSKRKAVFFPEDNRLIESYRVAFGVEESSIFVTFAEPNG